MVAVEWIPLWLDGEIGFWDDKTNHWKRFPFFIIINAKNEKIWKTFCIKKFEGFLNEVNDLIIKNIKTEISRITQQVSMKVGFYNLMS